MRAEAPAPYDPLAGFAVVVLVVVVALWAVVWHLRRTATADADVPAEIDARAAARELQAQVAVEGPPPAPDRAARGVAGVPPSDLYPPGVSATTPVWLATDRAGVKAHRLSPSGWRTPEGYAVVAERGRKLGVTMPAGLARATRHVQFCRCCFPPVLVIPGRTSPRRSPR